MSDGPSRRRRTVLAACAAGVVSLAGCGNPLSDSGGDDGSNGTAGDETNGTSGNMTGNGTNDTTGNGTNGGTAEAIDPGSTIRFGGESQGWVGDEPESIVGETNPPLQLQAGETYEIVWENLDGEEHELILVDGNDEELEASGSSESEGETVSMEFTASEELAAYYCEYHPEAMRGEFEITSDD